MRLNVLPNAFYQYVITAGWDSFIAPFIIAPQILYNRTMVQLGICAFRQGMIKDAHNALLDIQSSGRAKELLGQGLLMRNMQERNAEQEKIEKRRQVRFDQ